VEGYKNEENQTPIPTGAGKETRKAKGEVGRNKGWRKVMRREKGEGETVARTGLAKPGSKNEKSPDQRGGGSNQKRGGSHRL